MSDPTLQLLGKPDADDAPPPVLLPYQQAWIADEALLKVAEKGRRVGLTWAEAADNVLTASRMGGSNVFYISATQDMAREYIEACAMWTRAFHGAAVDLGEGLYDDGEDEAGNRRVIKTYEISYPRSGRRIVALSSRPTNLRGKQGDIVLDEAAFQGDLDLMFKAAMAMLLWGNRVRAISTHNGIENPFNRLVMEIRAGKRGPPAKASVHRITFASAVADGLFKRVCLRKGLVWTQAAEDEWVTDAYAFYGDNAAEELDAIPNASSGAYLSLAMIEHRMVPAWPANPDGPVIVRESWRDEFAFYDKSTREHAIAGWCRETLEPHLKRLNPLRRHAFGSDFARSGDLSVFVVGEEDADLTRRPKLVVEMKNCPFKSQEQIDEFIIRRMPRFRGGAMDATGNGASVAEAMAQLFGVEMVEQVKLNPAFYVAHMPKLKMGLQDGTLRDLPRDELHRDDLRAVQLVNNVPMVPHGNTNSAAAKAAAAEGGVKNKRHGDFAIALFLMEYAFHREAGEIAWTPAPGRDDRWGERSDSGAGRMRMRAGNHPEDMLAGMDGGRKGGW